MRWVRAMVLGALMLGGGSVRGEEILLPSLPALSPDGQTIAFSCEGDLWTVPVAGREARRLTVHPGNDSQPLYSPDGTQLAFVSDRTGSGQVYVMPAAGGEPRQVTWHTEDYTLEDWLPDGRSLLVSGVRDHYWRDGHRFFLVNLEKRTADELLFDAHGQNGKLSPDGQKLLFTREGERWWRKGYAGARAGQIWLYDRHSKEFTKILHKPTDCFWPLWKPDGKSFYYTCGAGSDGFNLWEYHLETKTDTQLTRFPADSVVFPALSRDGKTVVFRHLFHLYAFQPGVDQLPKRLTLENKGDRVIPPLWRRRLDKATNVSFTPDALEIAFIAGGDLWVMDTELKEPRQVTSTPEEEREPVFSTDGKTLFFLSDKEGQRDIWKAEPANKDQAFWDSRDFTLTRLTNTAEDEFDLNASPDGKQLFFLRQRGDIWVMQTDGGEPKRILESWNAPGYAISPDGKWLAVAYEDNDFNSDVFILPVDGSREPYNVSRHPDNDANPVWSPDGKMIAYTGQRENGETDIHYVFLKEADHDRDGRDRKLEQAKEKIQKARKPKTPEKKPGEKPAAPEEKKEEPQPEEKKEEGEQPAEEPKEDDKPAEPVKVQIDFDDLHKRVRRIYNVNVAETGLFFSFDSKKLYFAGSAQGKLGTYFLELPDKDTPQLAVQATGEFARSLPKTKSIVWLSNGVPGSVAADGKTTSYGFNVEQTVDRQARWQAAFDQCWKVMRDHWYDERLGNRNWDEIRRKYHDVAGQVSDLPRLTMIVHLMLGEINGSHLGFFGEDESTKRPEPDWKEQTAHLGVRFDPAHKGPGLKIRDVIPGSPADKAGSQLKPGEIILSINGVTVDPTYDLTQILNGSLERDLLIKVQATDEAKTEREVTLRPVDYASIATELYDMAMDQRETLVTQKSEGKFGYLHIRSMNMPSFVQFEKELYELGYGKDGLIIDVRDNGGGFTTDHLLTALTQPRHAITVPRGGGRGYPQDRMIYATWNKPIVVLCNQNSFSNAEIFSHAIKTLKRGQLVGVPTAGGVVSTGAIGIMDLGTLRLPFRGWYLLETGEDMELHGAVPHHILWPHPTDLPAGKDPQLEKALEVLTAEVTAWKARPEVKLKKATER